MGKGNKSVSQMHPIMKHMSNSAFRQEGVAQEKKDLMKDRPVDKDATSRGMTKHGPLHDHHGAMKKIGSMEKDGMPKYGKPLHAYGKPINKMGYKK